MREYRKVRTFVKYGVNPVGIFDKEEWMGYLLFDDNYALIVRGSLSESEKVKWLKVGRRYVFCFEKDVYYK